MNLRARLILLMVLLIILPSLPAVWATRVLVDRSLNLGLNVEVADALEAGVRRARESYQMERARLADDVAAWAGDSDAAMLTARAATAIEEVPGETAVLVRLDGTEVVLADAPTSDLAAPDSVTASASPTDPPRFFEVNRSLPDGVTLRVRAPVDGAWREDAATLASTLQVVRGLQAERDRLERTFWLPFLAIYGSALLLALAASTRISRGIRAPIQRLLDATRDVAAGRWDVQVPVDESGHEITHLGAHFNRMVRTLDVQSQRLVDLETMAGWREMARALAHEVKNPLTPIQLTVEEMRERYTGDDAEYRALLEECSHIVVKEVESLRNVVTRFREFSRPVEPRFVPVDLNELVGEVAALQRDLRVETDLSPDLGALSADPDRLRQALMNLARNAQAATREATSPRLRFATRAVGDRIAIIVEDNGPGIPPDQRERVFEPYRSGSAGGLGLGLALVKGIVLAHGGGIEVEEGPWGGARFRLEIPRVPEPEVGLD